MIAKLNATKEPLNVLRAKGFDKQVVKAMVQAYRKKPESKNGLNYAHFNAYELLELFMANHILSAEVASAIAAEKSTIEAYGLKIYMASHCFPLQPPYPGNIDPAKYLDKNTTILVNTKINKDGFWDMLDDQKSVAIARGEIEEGQGMDQSEIAPPYTVTTPDPNGEQDVNDAP